MKRTAAAFFILFMVISGASLALGESYTIPGSYNPTGAYNIPYNNIGISEVVTIDLNVTLVNTADYPKFVIVNPRYDFKVYRLDGSENLTAKIIGDEIYHIPGDLEKTTLNYYVGFWIMPYETVLVSFRITDQNPYVVRTADYTGLCSEGKITQVDYLNGEFTGGVIEELPEISLITCGVMYPQLINSPHVMYLKSMFPLMDSAVKVVKYDGIVRMRLTNVPGNPRSCISGDCEEGAFGEKADFWTLFAVTVPLVFPDGEMYGYTPHYTMTFREYMEEYMNFAKKPAPQNVSQNVPQLSGMFTLSDRLLTGITVGFPPESKPKSSGGLEKDLPVWIVLMKGEVEISYRVSWRTGGW
ncbi:MAG: hypothetical protein J7L37_00665 [Thermococcus sp.]|nr:hypothetical protein [Thermococcus sp.]